MAGSREEVSFRRATEDDAAVLTLLHTDVWEDGYTGLMSPSVFVDRRQRIAERRELWRHHLATTPATITLAAHGDRLVGFAGIGPGRDEDVNIPTEVWALYLRAEWWGRGVGHDLLQTVLPEGPAYLWVLEGKERAIEFYRRHHFTADGAVRHDEYGTELRMARSRATG